jgi:tRNA pseudouridine55 synthase
MKVTCSKGTYIRSLCYDIGEMLGVFATMTSLKRCKSSIFTEEDSINLEDLTSENFKRYLISMEEALTIYESITVEKNYVKLLINGVKIGDKRFTKDQIVEDRLYRVYDTEKIFLGLGKKDENGFKLEKLLLV